MNRLNQLIIEGLVSEVTTEKKENENLATSKIILEVQRLCKEKDGSIKEEFSYFKCIIRHYETTSYSKGDEIRIVGRLLDEENEIVILAEHTEKRYIA